MIKHISEVEPHRIMDTIFCSDDPCLSNPNLENWFLIEYNSRIIY